MDTCLSIADIYSRETVPLSLYICRDSQQLLAGGMKHVMKFCACSEYDEKLFGSACLALCAIYTRGTHTQLLMLSFLRGG